MVYGVQATAPVRAAFDTGRRAADLRSAVVALDMALASGVLTRARLAEYSAERTGWPGVTLVRRALELADPRSMSPKETTLRLIWLLDMQLPRPKSNWPVADDSGRYIGRPDLLCEELAVVGEFDGAHHRSRDRQRDDLRRDDLFRAVGLEPFRIVGADLYDLPLVVARIRAAIGRAARSQIPRTWRVKVNPASVAT